MLDLNQMYQPIFRIFSLLFYTFFSLQYFAFLFLAYNSEICKANNSPKSVDFFAEFELPNYTKISKYCANEIVAESWR